MAFMFLCQFAVRPLELFPFIYMMVSSSSGLNHIVLNILFGASLLLHFIVSLCIYLYHCMAGFITIVITSVSTATE